MYDHDKSDGTQEIRTRVEADAYLRYVELLEARGIGSIEKLYADMVYLLPKVGHFQKDPDLLVWLIVADNPKYSVPQVDSSVMSEQLKDEFQQICHSTAFKQISAIAHELAAWKTIKNMAFHAAFKLSIQDAATEEQISLERAKITAYAQQHKLICHEPDGNEVDYHAVTDLSCVMFDIALEACAEVKTYERRESDQWLLDEVDASHVTKQRYKTLGLHEEFFTRLFLGSETPLNMFYVNFMKDVGSYAADCSIDGETLLGVVNRQMRIEAIHRNEPYTYAEYWQAPKDQTIIAAAQAKAFVGTGSIEGSFGERAQELVQLRAESEHILDVVLKTNHPQNLNRELLVDESVERLEAIVPKQFLNNQLRALAEIMFDEALDIASTRNHVRLR